MDLPTREEIKLWIKTDTEGREWLAKQCDVAKTTIDQWLSKKEIPIAQHYKIASLMKPPEAPLEGETSHIRIPFTDEQLRLANQAASIVSSDFQEFCAKAIKHRAQEIIKGKVIDPALKTKDAGGDDSTEAAS